MPLVSPWLRHMLQRDDGQLVPGLKCTSSAKVVVFGPEVKSRFLPALGLRPTPGFPFDGGPLSGLSASLVAQPVSLLIPPHRPRPHKTAERQPVRLAAADNGLHDVPRGGTTSWKQDGQIETAPGVYQIFAVWDGNTNVKSPPVSITID